MSELRFEWDPRKEVREEFFAGLREWLTPGSGCAVSLRMTPGK